MIHWSSFTLGGRFTLCFAHWWNTTWPVLTLSQFRRMEEKAPEFKNKKEETSDKGQVLKFLAWNIRTSRFYELKWKETIDFRKKICLLSINFTTSVFCKWQSIVQVWNVHLQSFFFSTLTDFPNKCVNLNKQDEKVTASLSSLNQQTDWWVVSQAGRQADTDIQTGGQADRRTDGQTDRAQFTQVASKSGPAGSVFDFQTC